MDWSEIITAAVTFIFFIIYVINQLVAAARKQQQRPAPRPMAPQDEVVIQGDELTDEIQQFLRQAAQRREQAAGGRAAGAEADIEILDAEVISQPRLAQPLSEHAGESVAEHIDHFETHAHVSDEVDQADEQMQHHVAEVFEHSLGKLGSTASVTDEIYEAPPVEEYQPKSESAPTPAIDFAAMLASGDDVRRAIVMSEILQRPQHRW